MFEKPINVRMVDWDDAVRYAVFLHPWGITEEFNQVSNSRYLQGTIVTVLWLIEGDLCCS